MNNCASTNRNQLKRDKVRGLKRVELKLNADAVDALNELAEARNMSRSDLIEEMLMTPVNRPAQPGKSLTFREKPAFM
ncbi:LexA regulated protein [Klebsiella pneumoniae subsp. ozaenae]|uniref:LexA regulated protein n=1 Tax=Klebsiella pneumoniae subsp. ozaenae TaxID=574 RepID=A0A378BTQ1_KLEPO|nr:LexA regulated protein [Klebsiella pneumoniae subsp. ozaenae]